MKQTGKSINSTKMSDCMKRKYFYMMLANKLNGDHSVNYCRKDLVNEIYRFYVVEVFNIQASLGKRFSLGNVQFYGRYLDRGNISVDDAKYITSVFIVHKVIECIKKYESIFKRTIIDDYSKFENQAIDMVYRNEIDFMLCEGLTSNMKYISKEIIIDSIEPYIFYSI